LSSLAESAPDESQNERAGSMRPLVVVTGASAGIGEAIARRFAANNYDLFLIARRQDRLQILQRELHSQYGVNSEYLAVDLSDADCVERIGEAIGERPVCVLVNNAGVMVPDAFEESDPVALSAMLEINVVATVLLTRRLLPAMVKRGQGRILTVSSMAGFLPIPRDTVYAATKAFCNSFSQALGLELKKKGISVTVLCPGLTDTVMVSYTLAENKGVLAKIKRLMLSSAEQVAASGYEGCMKGKSVVVPGALNRFFSVVYQILPLPIARFVGATLGRHFT
jgi:short-subunit dehydrogenase